MRHIHLAACGVAVCTLTACGGGIAAPPTIPAASVSATAPPGTASPATSGAPTSPSSVATTPPPTTVGPAAVSLPPSGYVTPAGVELPDGPWQRVSGSPGSVGIGLDYRLDVPGVEVFVHLPTVEDLAAGVAWTLSSSSVPVLDGYLRSVTADLRAHPEAAADGLVLRPQVLGDERTDTTAMVGDCWIAPDGSGLGRVVHLRVLDAAWTVSSTELMEDMCWLG